MIWSLGNWKWRHVCLVRQRQLFKSWTPSRKLKAETLGCTHEAHGMLNVYWHCLFHKKLGTCHHKWRGLLWSYFWMFGWHIQWYLHNDYVARQLGGQCWLIQGKFWQLLMIHCQWCWIQAWSLILSDILHSHKKLWPLFHPLQLS